MENNETFKMTYSAQQQEEIQAIRKKYAAPAEDKMAQLRALDASVGKKATTVSLILGIVGALVLGVGMCFTMTDLGEILGTYRNMSMVIGIGIGIVGIVLVSIAYPVYHRILTKERARIAPEILRLTEELMK